jgi:hypothetical protein
MLYRRGPAVLNQSRIVATWDHLRSIGGNLQAQIAAFQNAAMAVLNPLAASVAKNANNNTVRLLVSKLEQQVLY